MENVLVTGSSGFLGSHLVKSLKGSDLNATGMDLRTSEYTQKVCDIKNKSQIVKVLKENEIGKVVHLAAYIDAAESVRKTLKYIRNNSLNTAILLEAMRKADCKEIVFISSVAVYGKQKEFPIYESAQQQPINPYGLSKLLAERTVEGYHESYGMGYTILRPTNLYGIGQNSAYAGVISKFIEAAIKGSAPVLYGDRMQTRDFLNVSDMVEAIKTIIMNKGKDTAYNVSFGKSVRIIELLKTVQKITGASIEPKRRHERSGDIERSEVSNQKFVDAYGWKPKVELEAGLRELLYHYRTRV